MANVSKCPVCKEVPKDYLILTAGKVGLRIMWRRKRVMRPHSRRKVCKEHLRQLIRMDADDPKPLGAL